MGKFRTLKLGTFAMLVGLGAVLACGPTTPSGKPCTTTADCCDQGPSSLCDTQHYVCQPNSFCASDARCYGSRFGQCSGTGPTTQLPANASVGVTFQPQTCNEWCWAAGITMIANYYGLQSSQCVLASAYSDFAVNCCYANACGVPACNHGAGTGIVIDRAFQFVGITGVDTGANAGPLPEAVLAGEIAAGRPVLVAFQGPFVSHVAVVTAYATVGGVRQFHIMDPWFGEVDRPYATFATGGPDGLSPWDETWYQLRPR
jgi:hypothetical protein